LYIGIAFHFGLIWIYRCSRLCIQKIEDLFIVDLQKADTHLEVTVLILFLRVLDLGPELVDATLRDAVFSVSCRLFRVVIGPLHRVSFTGASLPVRKDSAVVAIDHPARQLSDRQPFIDLVLVSLAREHRIKLKGTTPS